LIEKIIGIIGPKLFYFYPKLVLNHIVEYRPTSDFVFNRYNHTTLVQSSTKIINHRPPELLGTFDGCQTSLWIKEKGRADFLLDGGKDTLLCLANSHTEQWKFLVPRSLDKFGNLTLRV